MGLSFHEVMRGPMKDAMGHTHLVDFTVHAEAPSLSHFIMHGRAHLTGVVRARPWVEIRLPGNSLSAAAKPSR